MSVGSSKPPPGDLDFATPRPFHRMTHTESPSYSSNQWNNSTELNAGVISGVFASKIGRTVDRLARSQKSRRPLDAAGAALI